jgi:predicted O-methyltransferase YrrM
LRRPRRDLLRRLVQVRALPPRVAAFHARALTLAWRLDDEFAWESATRPADVAALLGLAKGRRRVVELGTATGWGAAAFVLADPERVVTSFDPVVQEHRARYLALVAPQARARLELIQAAGEDGAVRTAEPVDFLFVDSTHSHEGTVAELAAWRTRLAPDGLVVLHDYGSPRYPGVASAVAELGLEGEVVGGSFVWRQPTAAASAVTTP